MIIEANVHKMELVSQEMCSGDCGGCLSTYVTLYAANFLAALQLGSSILYILKVHFCKYTHVYNTQRYEFTLYIVGDSCLNGIVNTWSTSMVSKIHLLGWSDGESVINDMSSNWTFTA